MDASQNNISSFLRRVKSTCRLFRTFRPWNVVLYSIVAIAVILSLVDLMPHVDREFFFASDSPQFQSEKKITEMFPLQEQIILSAKGDIYSSLYFNYIERLTDALSELPYVSGVKSLSNGPDGIRDALASPLWKRMLISDDGKTSNLIVFLENIPAQQSIPEIEKIVLDFSTDDFELKIAGAPYVVELIRRNLVRDFVAFSLAAMCIFALVIYLVFRSSKILLGTLISCLDACILTLLISQLLKVKIGILTANIFTIVFVMTLSHIIFITNNWRKMNAARLGGPLKRDVVSVALALTLKGSFWCMATTFLGFISLVFVQAKPLKELGISGSIGTIVAILVAYNIYPVFLRSIGKIKISPFVIYKKKKLFVGHYMWVTSALAFIVGICLTGLVKLDTDPSLLSYFPKDSELYEGLEYIDRNGGSSPLSIVIKDFTGEKFNTGESYQRLWQLQESLEQDPDVGSAVSLPVLLAEGKRTPLAFFFTLEGLMQIMENPKYDRVSTSFVTKDRLRTHFFLRMRESDRSVTRAEVIQRIQSIVSNTGFEPEILGGIYVLQGELSRMIATSLFKGNSMLLFLFIFIAYIVSRSNKITLAMVFCLASIPICILGIAGHLGIPLDVISSPAANIAIGMGIDSMIHMVIVMRRYLDKKMGFWQAWLNARKELLWPVVSSVCIIGAGFGIFNFSLFPPTQRFGMAVVFGVILSVPITLFVLPSVVGPWFYKE